MMETLRTFETEKRYQEDRVADMLVDLWWKEPLFEFKYFRIIDNDYPHDKVAKVHHMLIPARPVDDWRKLKRRELKEFKKIFNTLSRNYDCIAMNLPSVNSITNIVHWHLYVYK